MRFVYTGGPYKEYRGYVFANGKAVTIKDSTTETLLQLNKDFRRIEDEKEIRQETPKEVLGTITLKNKGGRPRKVI
jgi:hypothetical protein